jgi:hypothetical protein
MWVLLGTSYDNHEREPFTYFIGVFDDLQLAIKKRDELVLQNNANKNEYPIKKLDINKTYPYSWSWNDDDELG